MNSKTPGAPAGGDDTYKVKYRPAEIPLEFQKHEEAPDNPILKEIQGILADTDPSAWKKGGEDLNSKEKYPRSLDLWEQAYALDMPDSVLVLRSSQPVKSEYIAGGYTITPIALENFSVEIRGKGWNLRELVDPYYRNSARKDKKCDVLIDGSMAGALYKEVKLRIENYHRNKKANFEETCVSMLRDLPEKISGTSFSSWEHLNSDPSVSRFGSTIDGYRIEVARILTNDVESFQACIRLEELSFKNISSTIAKEIYVAIEELGKNTKLLALRGLLKGALGS